MVIIVVFNIEGGGKMSKVKKIGIVLILVGICLPVITLGFTSGYSRNAGLIGNIQRMEIVLIPGEKPSPVPAPPNAPPPERGLLRFDDIPIIKPIKPELAIPYKYIFAFGVVLVFAGIGTIALSNSKKG
jgi:hypothetical protein